MRIKQIAYVDRVLRFAQGEYVMSHVVQTGLDIRLLRLETEDGSTGWGEVIRRSRHDAEAKPREAAILDGLAGKAVADIPGIIDDLRGAGAVMQGLAFGLDTTYLDWLARKADMPLYAMLGGKRCDAVPGYYSFSGDDAPGAITQSLHGAAADWAVIQIKLGVGDRDADIAMIEAALAGLSPAQVLLADFNGALDPRTALSIIREFDDARIVWEEPCASIDENSEVAARCDQPVMFDQCLSDLASIARVAGDGLAHSVAIKPAFLGGLQAARAARDLCVAAGMPMRIDGPWCGYIASAATLHLACGAPPELLIAGCDLRQPLLLDEDWGGIRHLQEHQIAPVETSGHGVTPPNDIIADKRES